MHLDVIVRMYVRTYLGTIRTYGCMYVRMCIQLVVRLTVCALRQALFRWLVYMLTPAKCGSDR